VVTERVSAGRAWLVALVAVIVTSTQVWVMWRSLSTPAVLFTSSFDYKISLWAPTHGLFDGLNPYDPSNLAYTQMFDVIEAALHPPMVLLLASPTTGFDLNTGYLLFVLVSSLMMWAAAVIMIPPSDRRSTIAVVVTGLLLTVSGPGDEVLRLGQVTAFVVLGLALTLRFSKTWWGAFGVALVLVSPQFGLVVSVALLALRHFRLVLRGWLLAVLLSLPVAIWAVLDAGGIGVFGRGVVGNLRNAGGLGNALNRMDLPGRLGQGAPLWSLAGVVGVLVFAWILHSRRPDLNDEVALGIVALALVCVFSMPYYLPVALLVGASALWAAKHWRVVEWITAVMITLTIPAALWICVPLGRLVGIPAVRYWAFLTYIEGLLLLAIVVGVGIRIVRSDAVELVGRNERV